MCHPVLDCGALTQTSSMWGDRTQPALMYTVSVTLLLVFGGMWDIPCTRVQWFSEAAVQRGFSSYVFVRLAISFASWAPRLPLNIFSASCRSYDDITQISEKPHQWQTRVLSPVRDWRLEGRPIRRTPLSTRTLTSEFHGPDGILHSVVFFSKCIQLTSNIFQWSKKVELAWTYLELYLLEVEHTNLW